MAVLGSIMDSKPRRHDELGHMMKNISGMVQQRAVSASVATPDMQRSMASMILSRLELDEGVCEDEEALRVVEHAAGVLHGTSQGPAEQMASRICVMSERSLPPAECVAKLRTFLERDSTRRTTVSIGGIGIGAGAGAAT